MLTKQGIEQSKNVIQRLERDSQNLDRIKEITKKMESDKAFLTFARGTKVGNENLSKWMELSKIILELQSLIRALKQSTDKYLDNQTAYNDGSYAPIQGPTYTIQPVLNGPENTIQPEPTYTILPMPNDITDTMQPMPIEITDTMQSITDDQVQKLVGGVK